MLKKIAIALFVVSLSSAGNCPEYKCHKQGIDYRNTCMHPSDGNFLLQICQSNKLWFRMMYLTEMRWRDMLIHQESKSLALALTHHLLMRINWAASK